MSGSWSCTILSDSSSCGSGRLTYIPTFADTAYDYCYGSGNFVISPAPTQPFKINWGSNAWVSFTADDGSSVSGGNWLVEGTYYEVLNSSPSFNLPPIWMIKSSCDGQFIALNPTDADGDKMKCRWATQAEADSAYYRSSSWPSLRIDEDNCVVHYNGTMDTHGQGVKPIALMIEDFDVNGNVKSSTPIQFLAQVWTPSLSARSSIKSPRIDLLDTENDCWPNCYPVIPDDGDDDEIDGRKKRETSLMPEPRSSQVSYCNTTSIPVFDDSVVPLDGAELDVTSGRLDLTLLATSQYSGIAVYTYQGPIGFQCGAIDQNQVILILLHRY